MPPEGGGPPWAVLSPRRQAHVDRVVALLEEWGRCMRLDPVEARGWRDAGAWHDVMRETDEAELRRWSGEQDAPTAVLHGPAAAARLAAEGEGRRDVLEAIRWHTLGHPELARTGQALYMADFLEPGRTFLQADRAFLARLVPTAFADVYRQVVRLRLEWTLREGKPLLPSTVALWNRVRLGA